MRLSSRARWAGPLSCLLLAACATRGPMQPFSTDGCSLFPNHALIGQADWCHCCLAHDLAYWRGGPETARLNADEALKACVFAATGSSALAELMFAGVRAGDGPYVQPPYRWGYGWPFGRAYAELTPAEQRTADALEQAYVAGNPQLACERQAPACE